MAFFPGATADHYEALETAMGDAPIPPGRLVFATGLREGGLQVLQIWTSRDDLAAFNEEWLFPALSRLGTEAFPAPPTVVDFEAHDLEIRLPQAW